MLKCAHSAKWNRKHSVSSPSWARRRAWQWYVTRRVAAGIYARGREGDKNEAWSSRSSRLAQLRVVGCSRLAFKFTINRGCLFIPSEVSPPPQGAAKLRGSANAPTSAPRRIAYYVTQ